MIYEPTIDSLRLILREDERRVTGKIDDLYWLFTRTKRGQPPACVRPDLYDKRTELERRIKLLRRKGETA